MNAGSNTMEQLGSQSLRDDVGERTSLLASPPIRIWLMLLLVIFGLGILGGITELEQAVATLERSRLLTLFTAISSFFAIFAFTIGQAASTSLTHDGRVATGGSRRDTRAPSVSAYAGSDDYAAAFAETSTAPADNAQQAYDGSATPDNDDDFTEYFDVSAPQTFDPLETSNVLPGANAAAHPEAAPATAEAAPSAPTATAPPVQLAVGSGPRWLLAIDDFMTRPISRRTVMIVVAASSSICAFATWHWVGRVGETLTALIGVAILAALFSRVTQMAAQSRQVVDDLRTTNNRLVQEVVHRRIRDQRAGVDTADRWASTIDFDSAPLHDLEALRTKFLNEVSHELRGPITAINLAARIIMKHHVYDHDVVERFGSTIVVEGDRLAQIVNEFLELAKIESGCIAWNDDRIDPNDVVTSAIFAVETVAGERGVTLEADTEPELPPLVADRDRVVEALTILITAALRTSPENSTVTVHARRGAGETLFAVEDQGTGKREEKTFNIFGNPSSQTTTTAHDGQDSGGQGLGLCIASEIAAHYGGEMWAEGRVGEGAAFVLSIPDEAPIPVGSGNDPKTEAPANTAKREGPLEAGASGAGENSEDTKTRLKALAELDAETPTSVDTESPVLTETAASPVLPSILNPEQNPPAQADTAPTSDNEDDTDRTASTSARNESEEAHDPIEAVDSLGDLGAETQACSAEAQIDPEPTFDAYEAGNGEAAPWDTEFEQPCASEQMSLRELDDVLYGRTQAPIADDDDDSGDSSESDVTATADSLEEASEPALESAHLTEVKRGFGFSVHRSEDLQDLDDGLETKTPEKADPADPFDAWLAKADSASSETSVSDDTDSTSEASDTPKSLDSALAQLERSTAQLTTEVAARETCSVESNATDEQSQVNDAPSSSSESRDALGAIARGISATPQTGSEVEEPAEDHTTLGCDENPVADENSSDARPDHAAARAAVGRNAKHDLRKPQGGWQLASRIGASVVRRTPHRS